MSTDSKPCCALCTPEGLGRDPSEWVREHVAERGWAVPSVVTENPYDIGFSYTVGLEALGQPELIAFGQDPHALADALNTVARKTARRKEWRKRFQLAALPKQNVQVRPVLDQWRDQHAFLAIDYWDGAPFRLWQVRFPRAEGTFSWDGRCCTPPCQPLLDLEEPWKPLEHVDYPAATNKLWHRVVDSGGTWTGRWEHLGGRHLHGDMYDVYSVPLLADDVGFLDVVYAPQEPSGRRVIHEVVQRSAFATVRIDARGVGERRGEVEEIVGVLDADENVLLECNPWPLPHWVLGVPEDRLAWAEEVMRPLRRDGLAEYQIGKR